MGATPLYSAIIQSQANRLVGTSAMLRLSSVVIVGQTLPPKIALRITATAF